MRTRRARLALGAALGLLSTAACTASNGNSAGDAVAVRGGTLHVLSSIDLEHLDPARAYVTSSQDVGRLIYRTLTTFAPAPGPAARSCRTWRPTPGGPATGRRPGPSPSRRG
ncbi:hypothetical protein ACFQ0T_02455 [Kitasatospora gansuensis]